MASDKKNFSVTNTVKKPFVSLLIKRNERLFSQIKNAVLGKNYNLSMVFAGKKKIRTLNRVYRGKDKATDVLSFPLSKTEGEIFINLDSTKTESKKFERELGNFVLYLVIHAFCHLKGMAHGSRMEREERKYRKIFKV